MSLLLKTGVELKDEDLFLTKNVTQDDLEKYFNHIVERFREENIVIEYDKIRNSITDTMNELCDISGEYNVKVGNSVSYRDLIRLEVEDSEAEKLFHPTIKPGQFNEIEQQFKEEGDKLIEYFTKRTDSELHPFVTSKTGINKKQLTQAIG